MGIEDRTPQGVERRHFNIIPDSIEFRDDEVSGFTFEGVASVVDTPYEVADAFGSFTETIRAGAFTKTLRDSKADIALFVNHDYRGIPLATRNARTLRLVADPHLRVSADLDPARIDVQTLRSAVTRGEMNQMSIGFSVPRDKQTWSDDYSDRQIHELKLAETSIVWQGANPLTVASMRSIAETLAELTAGDVDEDELRRIKAHIESLLPTVEPEVFPVTVEELEQFWNHAA
jgi:HK97 family phage prohead protease